jgi:8-oxo-dGTP pyrophosphatase MutT (NUDIX family)
MANLLNKILFWISWPVLYLVVNNTERTRAIIFNENKELLVVRGWINDGKWQLPGGGMKSKESSIDATIREVKEEVNLSLNPKQMKLIGSEQIIDNRINYKCDFFQVNGINTGSLKPGSEIKEIKFIKTDQIENISKEVIIAIDLIGLQHGKIKR